MARLRLLSGANIAGAARAQALSEAAAATALVALEGEPASGGKVGSPSQDGTPRLCSLPRSAVAAVEDEVGKLDLNAAPQAFRIKALSGLGAGDPDALAKSIVARRSARANALSDQDRAYAADPAMLGLMEPHFEARVRFVLSEVLREEKRPDEARTVIAPASAAEKSGPMRDAMDQNKLRM